MLSEKYDIGLGNNNVDLRKEAQYDFVSFWDKQAHNLTWFSPWERTLDWNSPFAKWFVGGKINASYNTLDIHQTTKSQKPAIFWEGENGDSKTYTYGDLFREVQKFANVLKSLGVQKGDRVTIYLPMVPELPIAMLACARIGAIHTVVFSGFSAASIKDRIDDSKSKIVITADGGFKSKIDPGFANQWLTTLNGSASIWRYVQAFGDVGLIKNKGEDVFFAYDTGIRVDLITDYFEVYFPMYSNRGWEINQSNYAQRIRFVFTTDFSALASLFTRKWF